VGYLAAEHLSDGAAVHRLVMGEHPHRPAVDGAVAGDHAVAVERVRVARCAGQCPDLQEAARVEQGVDAGARTCDALLFTLGGGGLTAGFLGQLQLFTQFGQQLGSGLRGHLGAFC
jgi:hypothetical protein